MKLTTNQIDELYKFTCKHYVEYYDVQTELVDHLANDIEEICKEQSNLSFEQARAISFKKFGVFGFMDIVEARSGSLNKKYWELVLRIFKDYFKIPQIFSIFLIFTGIYSSFLVIPNHNLIYIILGFGICAVLIIRLFQLHQLKSAD